MTLQGRGESQDTAGEGIKLLDCMGGERTVTLQGSKENGTVGEGRKL